MGADTVNVVPHSHYECRDGRWLAIACTNDEMFARLARAMGQGSKPRPRGWPPEPR
jgi:crotonobetainyl-CoA:carnitine CoA-transferase CaiB-like acyl-CoA transferase